jgi:hypothetical protein
VNSFQIALLVAALITAAVSRHQPRALLWISAGAASFVLSTAWARYGLPYPAWFTGVCDATVCLLVYFFGRQKWEMGIGYLFQASVLLSIGYLTGVIGPHYAYVIGLEAINWAALLLINLTVVASMLGRNGVHFGWGTRGSIRWTDRALHAKRQEPPFTKVPQ